MSALTILLCCAVCFFAGFLVSSFLISWYHQERDSHIIRLQNTLDDLIGKARQEKSLEQLKQEFDDESE